MRINVNGLALVVEGATNVVWVGVGDDNCVNVRRLDVCGPYILEQFACGWGQVAGAHIHQHPLLAGVDVQKGVRRGDKVDGQVALLQGRFNLCFGYIGKEVVKGIIAAAITDRNTFKLA